MAHLSEVFISGGLPTVTYNPRKGFDLETKLKKSLDQGYKILAIIGPHNSGKTVLIHSHLNSEKICLIEGGQIKNINSFYGKIIGEYEGYTNIETTDICSTGHENKFGGKGGINIWALQIGGGTSTANSSGTGTKTSRTIKYTASVKSNILLNDNIKTPLIIDDFYKINQETQIEIIRYLKHLVFRGLRVIIISVPYHEYDIVKVEEEMDGRLTQIIIPMWEKEELEYIMQLGFNELNVEIPQELIDSFAKESFGSPYFTQDFCYKFCDRNGVTEILESKKRLEKLPCEDEFFKEFVLNLNFPKAALDYLSQGSGHRKNRKERTFADGTKGDIYQAILSAMTKIAKTEPKTFFTDTEIKSALNDILKDKSPEVHEIIRVFDMMTESSKEYSKEKPAVDYNRERGILYMPDPCFAYYLRWSKEK